MGAWLGSSSPMGVVLGISLGLRLGFAAGSIFLLVSRYDPTIFMQMLAFSGGGLGVGALIGLLSPAGAVFGGFIGFMAMWLLFGLILVQ
nr:hypothetical protein [Candidatus Sigynarchaeota archaeon]